MPEVEVLFENHSLTPLSLELNVSGFTVKVKAYVDTGFMGEISGVKISSEYARYVKHKVISTINLADGSEVPIYYTPNGRLTKLEGKACDLELPVVFMDGPSLLGCRFLKRCKLCLDGWKSVGSLVV